MNSHPSEADIAALAHRYYEEEGHPEGKAEEHWARAEREIRKQCTAEPQKAHHSISDEEKQEEVLDYEGPPRDSAE